MHDFIIHGMSDKWQNVGVLYQTLTFDVIPVIFSRCVIPEFPFSGSLFMVYLLYQYSLFLLDYILHPCHQENSD